MHCKKTTLGVAARSGLVAIAVAFSGCSAPQQGSSSSATAASGADGGSDPGSTGGRPGAAGSDGTPLIIAGDACGIGTEWAQLAPLNMLVMFDRSGSMEDDDKWPNATSALTSFFENPAAAELRVALRFFPHQEPAKGCTKDACDAAACAQPLVELAPLIAASAPTDTQEDALVTAIRDSAPGGEGNGTPIHAALDGALRWASDFKRSHVDEKTVVVFVTDGKPNGCEEDFDSISALAEDALASPGVSTYAIGLAGSSEAQMDQLARAGGTTMGIFIDQSVTAEEQLLSALNGIRGQNLSCDFAFPEPLHADEPIDPSVISVSFIYSAGAPPLTLAKVIGADGCGGASAWYYDDPRDPARIFLCPTACDAIRAEENAGLQILLGCAVGDGTPLDCMNQPDDPSCRVE